MNEVFPVVSGVVAGLALGRLTALRRPWLWMVVSVVLGLSATLLSGEWKVSWAYLLVDIPLVGVAASAAYLVSRRRRLWQLRRAAVAEYLMR